MKLKKKLKIEDIDIFAALYILFTLNIAINNVPKWNLIINLITILAYVRSRFFEF